MSRETYIRNEIERLHSGLLRLELECTGVVLVGETAEELRGLAKRITDLCSPTKGHLPAPVAKPVEVARAA